MSIDLIDQFIARYRREFDFFEQAGRLVAQQLDSRLQASGVRAMVTSRAKNPRRLEPKVRQRAKSKTYITIDDIYSDIVDLAGVRVALYFPGERKEADKIIQDQFTLTSPPKEFIGTSNPSYAKRFSGYWATHYRLQLRESSLPEASQRYSDARIEVQVASVLMHAWAEVEHDLVYKPLQGNLSEDELAILDELNGMMLAGEIALERLQRAAEVRVKGKGSKFENHYDLASFLLEAAKPLLQDGVSEPVLGDVELLFRLLGKLDLLSPDALKPYLESLNPDTERRPVAQQITDQVLAANPDRYKIYAGLRADSAVSEIGLTAAYTAYTAHTAASSALTHAALGYFLAQWITFERFLRELASYRQVDPRGPAIPSPGVLRRLEVFNPEELAEIEHIRRARNYLVHGVEIPDAEYIEQMGRSLEVLLDRLAHDERPEVSRAAQRAMNNMELPNPDRADGNRKKRGSRRSSA
jgi:ppGpp synthetase/RelA/SpoT-type nucleotidyltranferase